MEKLEFLEYLARNGVEFAVSFDAPGGCSTFCLKPKELLKFSENPDQFIADNNGVTLHDYLMWKEEEFSVRCAGTTAKNKRCRQIVKGGHWVSPAQWADMQGQYCAVHEEGQGA